MPIFDYICKDCGEEFEDIVLGDSKPQCPKCNSVEVERTLSAGKKSGVSFRLYGEGFYRKTHKDTGDFGG